MSHEINFPNGINTTSITASTMYGDLDWDHIIETPTTISGYGITDVYNTGETSDNFLSANTFDSQVDYDINTTGNITAVTYYGDGSYLTGIGGIGGVSDDIFNTYTGETAPSTYIPFSVADDVNFTTGILSRTDNIISFNSATTEFTITPTGADFSIYLDSVKYSYSTPQTITLSSQTNFQTNQLWFIFFGADALLGASYTPWDITSKAAPIAILYWNGTIGSLGDERHDAVRNLAWHAWAHDTLGTQYKSGLDATFTSASTLISSGVIEDEDIVIDISETTTLSVWHIAPGNTATTFRNELSETSAYISGGIIQWDNEGVLTNVTDGYYVKNFIYANNDVDNSIATIIAQSEYSNINDARSAEFPEFPTYISPETRLIYVTIWKNDGGTAKFIESADFRTAKTAPNGVLSKRPLYFNELEDVIAVTPDIDDTLRFNGVNWITGPGSTTSIAGGGQIYYYATPDIFSITTDNENIVANLSRTPIITGETYATATVRRDTVLMEAFLYDSYVSSIPAGNFSYEIYASVDSVASGRVTSVEVNTYKVEYTTGTTISTTGAGTTTVTADSGTPFTADKVIGSATNTISSYLQTPQGLYQITSRDSDTQVTITTPGTYSVESNITFSIWYKMFGVNTGTIVSITPNHGQYAMSTTQTDSTFADNVKLGSIFYAVGTDNNATNVSVSYNGEDNDSYFLTPLDILHNDLTGLNGGDGTYFYHLSNTEYAEHITLSDGSDASSLHIHDSRYYTETEVDENFLSANTYNFGTISVATQTDVVSDTKSDTLTLVAGTNMSITTDAGTDTITFSASGAGGEFTGGTLTGPLSIQYTVDEQADLSDGVFLDMNNLDISTYANTGIRFKNGTTSNTFKSAIILQDDAGYGAGDLYILNSSNNTIGGNASISDSRIVMYWEGNNVICGSTLIYGDYDVVGDLSVAGNVVGDLSVAGNVTGTTFYGNIVGSGELDNLDIIGATTISYDTAADILGVDSTILSVTNTNTNNNANVGIKFQNSVTTFKSGIIFQDKLSNARGDLHIINDIADDANHFRISDARISMYVDGTNTINGDTTLSNDLSVIGNITGDTIYSNVVADNITGGSSLITTNLDVKGSTTISYNTATDATCDNATYLFINNTNTDTNSNVGILFQNGVTTNTIKSGIIFQDVDAYGVGDLYIVNSDSNVGGDVNISNARISMPWDGNTVIDGDTDITGYVSATTYYGDGSNLTGISGSGTINTASNLGTGYGLFTSVVSDDLPFKSLVAGSNISINSSSTEITISSTATGGGGVVGESLTATTTTTDATESLLTTLSISTGSTSYRSINISAYGVDGVYGVWERKIIIYNSGTTEIKFVSSTVDYQEGGLEPTSVDFSVNGTNVDVDVTGLAATNILWNIKSDIEL